MPTRGRRIVLLQTQAEAAGAQEVSLRLAHALRDRGHEVAQVFLFRRTAAFDDEPGAIMCAAERPRDPLALARLLARLFRELRRLRPDIVVCFQHFGNLVGAPVARLAGVGCVIANHNGLQDLLSPAVIRTDRLLGTIGAYSRIVVNSEAMAREYDGYPAAYRARLTRIDHGFQEKASRLAQDAARSSFGLLQGAALSRGRALLGCVARLSTEKQLDAAIRLLPLEPGWHLALAGQGAARAELEALADRLGCRDRLHLVGELTPARVGDFLRALDVFVFPSRTETFGLAAAEAAQAGIPVVANRLPILEDVLSIEGEPCAAFVDVTDTASFRDAVARMLADTALAECLAARGRRLGARFPLDAMVDGYEALIRAAE